VPDKHLSLAIGKEGQNVRLAAKLTGWRIDIKSASELEAEKAAQKEEAAEPEIIEQDQDKLVVEGLEPTEETAAEALAGEEEETEVAVAAAEGEGQAEGVDIEILMPVDATTTSQPSKIRFAEEIMAGRNGKSKKKEAPKKEGEGKDTGSKAKKTKAKKKTYYEDEDFES